MLTRRLALKLVPPSPAADVCCSALSRYLVQSQRLRELMCCSFARVCVRARVLFFTHIRARVENQPGRRRCSVVGFRSDLEQRTEARGRISPGSGLEHERRRLITGAPASVCLSVSGRSPSPIIYLWLFLLSPV